MPNALLTIIVPTYNRAAHLAVLLTALRAELSGLEPYVRVLVSDNASTDSTQEITASAKLDWPALTLQRHQENLGPEGNFLSCLAKVSTKYFWIMGDDDCPKRGVLAELVSLLQDRNPALLFLNSQWVEEVVGPDQGEVARLAQVAEMNALQFAKAVHVWVTFISGMIVNRDSLLDLVDEQELNKFDQTSLVQLGWVLPLLKLEGPFLYVYDECVRATKENSGGYKLLTVFGANFTKIVNESFGINHPIARSLIMRNLTQYLPHLIWAYRNASKNSKFIAENPWRDLGQHLGSYWIYWLLLAPMGRLPLWMARPFYLSWRLINWLSKKSPFSSPRRGFLS